MKISIKQPIIIGLDPGTTLGYAVLDIDGNIIAVKSSRQHRISNLIKELIGYGKIVIVASDVHPAASIVKKLASKTGARLMQPSSTLRIKDKKRLTSKHNYSNAHERDALAAAIYSFKRIRSLLKKVDLSLGKDAAPSDSGKIKSLLLTNPGMSISRAVKSVK